MIPHLAPVVVAEKAEQVITAITRRPELDRPIIGITAVLALTALITVTPKDILALAAEAAVCTTPARVATTALGAVAVLRAVVTAATTLVGVTLQLITVLVAEVAHALRRHPLLRAVTAEADIAWLAFHQPVIP